MLEICTAVATKSQAEKMAAALIENKFVACVSFWKVTSIYRWKDEVHKAGEWLLCAKTSEKLGKKAEKKLQR